LNDTYTSTLQRETIAGQLAHIDDLYGQRATFLERSLQAGESKSIRRIEIDQNARRSAN
jgi:hypothetical protein